MEFLHAIPTNVNHVRTTAPVSLKPLTHFKGLVGHMNPGSRHVQSSERLTKLANSQMGGCQNCGPLWGTLNIRCHITIGTQKGTIILTTTQIKLLQFMSSVWANCRKPCTKNLRHWELDSLAHETLSVEY